jgi:hypothetical protein
MNECCEKVVGWRGCELWPAPIKQCNKNDTTGVSMLESMLEAMLESTFE